jgi:hypothetical protein
VTIPDRIERLAQHEEALWARAFETQVLLTPRPRKVNAQHARIVALGGGDYVPGMLGDLVLFNSPATGSTIALREADLTPDAVRQHIAESNARFGVRE